MQERLPEKQALTAEIPLHLGLLGAFTLRVEGQEIEKLSRSVKYLLALFAVNPSRPLRREWLAETLWPEADPERSAFYLRRSLTELRAALGAERVRLTSPIRNTLFFDFTGAFCDVLAFDRQVGAKDVALLEAAVALYRGTFLEECDEEWVQSEKTQRTECYLTALETLGERRVQHGNLLGAMEVLRCAVKADPLRETAQRKLMRLMGQTGDYVGVERQYRVLRTALHAAFQSEPTQETVALYQDLRSQSRASLPAKSPNPASRPFSNLPHALTSLVGRREEREQVHAALRDSRLVTLVGPGGVGKTRLALFVAEAETGYSAGVCFADLTGSAAGADVPQTLAAALHLQAAGDTTLLESLRRYLQPRPLLLILDNAEHVAEACASLADNLLRHCPHLTILCTSRQPLYVVGETVLSVAPLAVWEGAAGQNADPAAFADILRCTSVCLLMDRVRSAAPAFRLDPADTPAIAAICRFLDGLPLALELVAVQFRVLSPREIAARLNIRFRLLGSGSPAQPRHRTLRAALDWSYELLSQTERTLLRHLSVFRGGWTREAAEAVCRIPSADTGTLLTSLVEKSLVVYETRNGQGRYRLLEMTRQYAEELLDDAERFDLQQRHAAFFLRIAQAAEAAAKARYWPVKTDALWQERDNFRAAHSWLQQRDTDEALWLEFFLYMATLWTPENTSAWIARQQQAPMPPTQLGLRVAYCVSMWALWGQHPATESLLHAFLEAARLGGEPVYQIRCLDLLSILETERGDVRKSGDYLKQAVQIHDPTLDAGTVSVTASKYAVCLGRLGQMELAVERLEAQIQKEKACGEWEALCFTLLHLGELLLEDNQFEQAQFYLNQGVFHAEPWQPLLLPYFWQKLGDAAFKQEDFAGARACLNHGLTASRRNGTPDRQAWAYWDLAKVSFHQDCREEAEAHLRESILIFQAIHEPHSILRCLLQLAKYCIAWEQPVRAAMLLGSVDRAREEYCFRDTAKDAISTEPLADVIRQSIGTPIYEENWQWGRQRTLVQAVDFILHQKQPQAKVFRLKEV